MHKNTFKNCLFLLSHSYKSSQKVNNNEVKNDMGEDEVGEASLSADAVELVLVVRVHLETETDAEHEGSHAADEASEEGVEGEGSDQAHVHELKDPGEENVGEVRVDELELDGGLVRVLLVELGDHAGEGGHCQVLLSLSDVAPH